jgi:predicted phosphodiesterase
LRYGIISDIHSNLDALNAVLNSIKNQGIDKLICLGDIVGYGPEPNECVENIKSNADLTLAGNHDFAVLDKTDITKFNRHAKSAIQWTKKHLSDTSREFLQSLSLIEEVENFVFVHATPDIPIQWKYILSLYDAYLIFLSFEETICFFGHTHVPSIFVKNQNGHVDFRMVSNITINPENQYLINVGSVGQPRDRDPRAAYAVFDTTSMIYDLYRIEYDIKSTQSKMKNANLDRFLIYRLQDGR